MARKPVPPGMIGRTTLRQWATRQRALNAQRVVAGTFTAGFDNAMACLIERLDTPPAAPRQKADR